MFIVTIFGIFQVWVYLRKHIFYRTSYNLSEICTDSLVLVRMNITHKTCKLKNINATLQSVSVTKHNTSGLLTFSSQVHFTLFTVLLLFAFDYHVSHNV